MDYCNYFPIVNSRICSVVPRDMSCGIYFHLFMFSSFNNNFKCTAVWKNTKSFRCAVILENEEINICIVLHLSLLLVEWRPVAAELIFHCFPILTNKREIVMKLSHVSQHFVSVCLNKKQEIWIKKNCNVDILMSYLLLLHSTISEMRNQHQDEDQREDMKHKENEDWGKPHLDDLIRE